MTANAQRRATRNYRTRLTERGLARFEVLAPAEDRELLRDLASRLAQGGAEAERVRQSLRSAGTLKPRTGQMLIDAIRNSPLKGADLDLSRDWGVDREIDL